MVTIENTLLYLRESLSNYLDDDLCKEIYHKIENNPYASEEEFVSSLDDKEMAYLDKLLERELSYANNVDDGTRLEQLTEIYEQLF